MWRLEFVQLLIKCVLVISTLSNVLCTSDIPPSTTMWVASSFSKDLNFTKMLIKSVPGGNFLYVAAINNIFQFNMDLTLYKKFQIGPKNYSVFCDDQANCAKKCNAIYTVFPPGYDKKDCGRRPTDAIVKVWNTDDDYLYVCYNLYHGGCERLRLKDLTPLNSQDHLDPEAVVNGDPNAEAALVVTNNYIFVGVERDIRKMYTFFELEAMSMRLLNFSAINKLKPSRVQKIGKLFMNDYEDPINPIRYKYAFRYRPNKPSPMYAFVYFITVIEETSRQNSGRRWRSKISRICEEDKSFNSFIEVDLKCTRKNMDTTINPLSDEEESTTSVYDVLLSVTVTKVGSRLAKQLNIKPDEDVIVASFSLDDNLPRRYRKDSSYVCFFPMNEVDAMIHKVALDCSNGDGQIGPRHYTGYYSRMTCLRKFNNSGPIRWAPTGNIEGEETNLETKPYCPINSRPYNWPVMGDSHKRVIRSRVHIEVENSIITAVAVSRLSSTETILMAAGADGVLYKYSVNKNDQSRLIDRIPLVNRPFTGVVMEPSALKAFVSTEKEVLSVHLHNCSIHTNCSSCIQLRDPYCGWCVAKGMCLLRSQCQSDLDTWLDHRKNPNRCPQIQSLSPIGIEFSETRMNHHQLMTIRVVNVNQRLLMGIENNISCLFRHYITQKMINMTKAAVAPGIGLLTCNAPELRFLPQLAQGQSHTGVELIVRTGDRVLTSGELPIYDCTSIFNCHDCTRSRFKCDWCVVQSKCLVIPLRSKICGRTAIFNNPNSSCPSFLFPAKAIAPVSSGSDFELVTTIRNKASYMVNFECGLSCLDKRSSGIYDKYSGRLTCKFIKFYPKNKLPAQNCSVEIFWDNMEDIMRPLDNPNSVSVEVIDCPTLASECDHCQQLPDRYKCNWCPTFNSCTNDLTDCLDEKITRSDLCNNPIISSIFPMNGTIDGNTLLTIRGKNLGTRASDITSINLVIYAMLNRIPCKMESYIGSREMTCRLNPGVTPSLGYKGGVVISINRKDTSFKPKSVARFAYLKPSVSGLSPSTGPIDGGTVIKISGHNLNIGRQRKVFFRTGNSVNVPCDIVPGRESPTLIVCITGSRVPREGAASRLARRHRRQAVINGAPMHSQLMLQYDSSPERLIPSIAYTFAENPVVQEISRNVFVRSGGLKVFVTGNRFDTIQKPKIIFIIDNNDDIIGNCQTINSSRLECLSPSLKNTNRSTTEIITHCGFIMDAVRNLRKLKAIKIVDDPKIEDFLDGRKTQQLRAPSSDKTSASNNHDAKASPQVQSQIDIRLTGRFPVHALMKTDFEVVLEKIPLLVVALTRDALICALPVDFEPEEKKGYLLTVRLGERVFVPGSMWFEILQPPLSKWVISVIIAVVVGVIIAAIVIIVCVLRGNARKNCKQQKLFQQEMTQIESKVATECKEAFAELTTDISMFTQDLAIGQVNIPYNDHRIFCISVLFPDFENPELHPILSHFKVSLDSKINIENGLRIFTELISNQTFLLTMIRVMEADSRFKQHAKVKVGSLLSAALQPKMEYFTEILKQLIQELIEKSQNEKKNPRLLMRRAESVAEKMLPNWFAFLLYSFLKDRVGEPLYLLYTAIVQRLQKGPIDAKTGAAKFTMNQEQLIRTQIDFKEITLEVADSTSNFMSEHELLKVRVLDCDSITQVKEKILNAKFKHIPSKDRKMTASDIDLYVVKEYLYDNGGSKAPPGSLLTDIDSTSVDEDRLYRKINTLRHYQVPDGACVCICPRSNDTGTSLSCNDLLEAQSVSYQRRIQTYSLKRGTELPAYRSESMASRLHLMPNNRTMSMATTAKSALIQPEIQEYHLVKSSDDQQVTQDTRRKKKGRDTINNPKLMSEVYLNRLLGTKQLLHPSIDQLLTAMFSTRYRASPLPLCIKYMFDFLDMQARKHKFEEPDIVHSWKSNSLPLRFWVPVVKFPRWTFDVDRQPAVENCLNVIGQTLMDACSTSDNPLTANSPAGKLLFAKDINNYRSRVSEYYQDITRLPAINVQEMNTLLNQHSREFENEFNVSRALAELYIKYVKEYYPQILAKLKEDPNAVKMKLDEKLTQVNGYLDDSILSQSGEC